MYLCGQKNEIYVKNAAYLITTNCQNRFPFFEEDIFCNILVDNIAKYQQIKPLPPTETEKIPFELPEGWVWCHLKTLAKYIIDCPHSTPEFQTTGINCIDTTCNSQ